MILEGGGCPEDSHDRIACELLHRSSGALDLVRHPLVEPLEAKPDTLGVLPQTRAPLSRPGRRTARWPAFVPHQRPHLPARLNCYSTACAALIPAESPGQPACPVSETSGTGSRARPWRAPQRDGRGRAISPRCIASIQASASW